jgi:multiple sugar transport system substrate-binding protein
VVVNARTRDLDAAWQFVEWATGADFLRRSAFEGNMNPTRVSTWDDEEFRARAQAWGSFYDVARRLVEHEASVLVTPAANYREVAARWVRALRDAYAGRCEVREGLEAAAAEIDSLVSAGVAA